MLDYSKDDLLFRQFQIEKFSPKRTVPMVYISIEIDITKMMDLRQKYNSQTSNENITIQHVITSVVSKSLVDYPLLFSYFKKKRIILNEKPVINIPVNLGNRIGNVIIPVLNRYSIEDISQIFNKQLKNVRSNETELFKQMKKILKIPKAVRNIAINISNTDIKFMKKYYGNFVITNMGSLGLSMGLPVISSPLVAAMCVGGIKDEAVVTDNGIVENRKKLTLSLTFDHRPMEASYPAKFLNEVKKQLESPEVLFRGVKESNKDLVLELN